MDEREREERRERQEQQDEERRRQEQREEEQERARQEQERLEREERERREHEEYLKMKEAFGVEEEGFDEELEDEKESKLQEFINYIKVGGEWCVRARLKSQLNICVLLGGDKNGWRSWPSKI